MGRETVSIADHNEVVPEVVKRIIIASGCEADAFIMAESILLGVMLYYRPNRRHAAEFLDTITERVIGRMLP